jgi:hypothetical protein
MKKDVTVFLKHILESICLGRAEGRSPSAFLKIPQEWG